MSEAKKPEAELNIRDIADSIKIIDGLENFNNNSISGTGGLLQ